MKEFVLEFLFGFNWMNSPFGIEKVQEMIFNQFVILIFEGNVFKFCVSLERERFKMKCLEKKVKEFINTAFNLSY